MIRLDLNKRRMTFIPVLTSRDAVEIDYNFQTMPPCPLDSLKEIFVLPLDIRLAGCDFVGPIPYRDAHVIESRVTLVDFSGASRSVLSRRTLPRQSTESRLR
jgi:hypothetical protein